MIKLEIVSGLILKEEGRRNEKKRCSAKTERLPLGCFSSYRPGRPEIED